MIVIEEEGIQGWGILAVAFIRSGAPYIGLLVRGITDLRLDSCGAEGRASILNDVLGRWSLIG
jgi:hypothetical protein